VCAALLQNAMHSEPEPVRWAPRRSRVIAVIVIGVLLALPNCGPGSLLSKVVRLENGRVATPLANHGEFEVVGFNVLMFDHVSVEAPPVLPLLSGEILRISSGGRPDTHTNQIRLEEYDGGVSVFVDATLGGRFDLSDEDIAWSRWLGPRMIVGEYLMPQWTMSDGLDAALFWLLAWLYVLHNQARSAQAEARP
jgi:hypothetical protein